MAKVSIDEGATYEFLTHGLGVAVVGLILALIHPLITIIFIIVGIALMAIKTGIEVDDEKQLMRKYKKSLFVKFGAWVDLKKVVLVELKYNDNQAKGFAGMAVTAPLIMPVPRTAKTFDLTLTNDVGEETDFNQFLKFSLALKTLKALEKIKHIEIVNHFEQSLFEERAYRKTDPRR